MLLVSTTNDYDSGVMGLGDVKETIEGVALKVTESAHTMSTSVIAAIGIAVGALVLALFAVVISVRKAAV